MKQDAIYLAYITFIKNIISNKENCTTGSCQEILV